MVFLLFHLGRDRYVLDATRVVEVLPLVELQRISDAPGGVAGIFNYRGQPVPAIDLSELTLGRPALEQLSTRLIVIRYPDETGKDHLLGLIAERATQTLRRENSEFAEPGHKLGAAPYLGPVLLDGNGVIQLIREQHLLPRHIRDMVLSDTLPTVP
jgi:chemotaxis-related protein WspB